MMLNLISQGRNPSFFRKILDAVQNWYYKCGA
jgi:hypothetical protein